MEFDYAGYTLAEARELLNKAGAAIGSIRVTAPPKHAAESFDESCRVVRITVGKSGKADILVCSTQTELTKPL